MDAASNLELSEATQAVVTLFMPVVRDTYNVSDEVEIRVRPSRGGIGGLRCRGFDPDDIAVVECKSTDASGGWQFVCVVAVSHERRRFEILSGSVG